MIYYRQGDVVIKKVNAPKNMPKKKVNRSSDGMLVLAEGEVSGHRHRIKQIRAEMFDIGNGSSGGGLAFLLKVEKTAMLLHEEHDTIAIPPGFYEIYHQREYPPAEIKRVVD